MMLYNAPVYEYHYDMQADQMFMHSGLADATLLPPILECNYVTSVTSGYGDEPNPLAYDDPEMINEEQFYVSQAKEFENFLSMSSEQMSEWRNKNIADWTSTDTKTWILDTAVSKKLKLAQIPSFQFSNITGLELIKMSKEAFCETMNTEGTFESILIGEMLYEELQNLLQEIYVPSTVVDKFSKDNNNEYKFTHEGESRLFDMDSSCTGGLENQIMRHQRPTIFCDSGYDSLSDDGKIQMSEEQCQIEEKHCISSESGSMGIVKRPPGRPKGSGKKLPKRIKNVSVPEFLRDLLLDRRYCPRIIKWEDYSKGKFRFVRANEVAELWGGKKNNPKMSFEKFSRAMRYHYKQEVLVSVPTARLVYQFGPKAPQFTTANPNFEESTPVSRYNR